MIDDLFYFNQPGESDVQKVVAGTNLGKPQLIIGHNNCQFYIQLHKINRKHCEGQYRNEIPSFKPHHRKDKGNLIILCI